PCARTPPRSPLFPYTTLFRSATVSAIRRTGDRVIATIDGQESEFGEVLIATGRRPATTGLGLEEVGVRVGERGEVVVDAHLRTADRKSTRLNSSHVQSSYAGF